jgi:hypothetical protein
MKKSLGIVLIAVILCSVLVFSITSLLHADCDSKYENCMAGCGVPGPGNPGHADCVNGCMAARKDCGNQNN